MAAPVISNVVQSNSKTTPFQMSYTPAAGVTAMVLFTGWYGATAAVTMSGATFNGVPAIRLKTKQRLAFDASANYINVEAWLVLAPPAVTANWVVTPTSGVPPLMHMMCMSISGCDDAVIGNDQIDIFKNTAISVSPLIGYDPEATEALVFSIGCTYFGGWPAVQSPTNCIWWNNASPSTCGRSLGEHSAPFDFTWAVSAGGVASNNAFLWTFSIIPPQAPPPAPDGGLIADPYYFRRRLT